MSAQGIGLLPLAAIPAWAWAAAGGATVLVGAQQLWGQARDYVLEPPALRTASTVAPAAPQSRLTMTVPGGWNPAELIGQTNLQQRQVNAAFSAGMQQSANVFGGYAPSLANDAERVSPWVWAALAGLAVALVNR